MAVRKEILWQEINFRRLFNQLQALDPVDDFFLSFPYFFLDLANELVVLSFFILQVIVGEVGVLLLDLTLQLVPVTP